MESDRVKKREREVSMVGPGTDDENPEQDDRGKSMGEVGRWGRRRPEESRHLPGVLDWDREEDLGSCLRERGALDLMTRNDLLYVTRTSTSYRGWRLGALWRR